MDKNEPKMLTTSPTIFQPCKHFSWVVYDVRITRKIRNNFCGGRMMYKQFYLVIMLDKEKTKTTIVSSSNNSNRIFLRLLEWCLITENFLGTLWMSNGGLGKLFVCLFWIGTLGFMNKMYGLTLNWYLPCDIGDKTKNFVIIGGKIFGDNYLPYL